MRVPQRRNGKYKQIITSVLSSLDRLPTGRALRITKAELTKGVRSALYIAARKSGRKLATLTDADFVYVWNKSE
jgi:hypothetical protein